MSSGRLALIPTDREFEKLGYDIESREPGTGILRFLEVKGRVSGAATITVPRMRFCTPLINQTISFLPLSSSWMLMPPRALRTEALPARARFRRYKRQLRFSELLARSEQPQ